MAFKKKQPGRSPAGNYAFIDSQNLNLGIQKAGWKMDWRKFRRFLRETYNVDQAYMFIGYIPQFEDLYMQLHDAGYLIVLKPTQDMSKPQPEVTDEKVDDKDKKPIKGNIDAELVLWAMKEKNKYDKAVIVSGDGDFYCLVEYLEEQGKLQKLLVPNRQYSSLFHKYESFIVRLDQHKNHLAYKKFNPRKKLVS